MKLWGKYIVLVVKILGVFFDYKVGFKVKLEMSGIGWISCYVIWEGLG